MFLQSEGMTNLDKRPCELASLFGVMHLTLYEDFNSIHCVWMYQSFRLLVKIRLVDAGLSERKLLSCPSRLFNYVE